LRRLLALGHAGRQVDRSDALPRVSGAQGAGGDRLTRAFGASPPAILWRAWAGAFEAKLGNRYSALPRAVYKEEDHHVIRGSKNKTAEEIFQERNYVVSNFIHTNIYQKNRT